MGWLSANWLWIAFIGAMLLMHARHGGMHGGHHGHDHQAHGDSESHDHAEATSAEAGNSTTAHRHGGC